MKTKVKEHWLVAAAAAVATAFSVACGGGGVDAPAEDAAAMDEAPPAPSYTVYVTNEYSGDLTVIAGATNEVVNTIPLGKRPRGIKVSPDRTQLFVALSGSPPRLPAPTRARSRRLTGRPTASASSTWLPGKW